MRIILPFLLMLLPVASNAQYWRIQASGGIGTSLIAGHPSRIYIGQDLPGYVSPGYYSSHMPEQELPFAVWTLALLRRLGSFELGLQTEAFSVRRSNSWRYYPPGQTTPGTPSDGYSMTVRVGRPAIPVTAVCNYYAGPARSSAYVGLHGGFVYAAGKEQIDFNQMVAASDITVYYRSALGFCMGAQAGYRREVGAMDFGFQLQAKYLQLSLQHGTEDTRYATRMFVLPVQLYAGFRFGHRKADTHQQRQD